jgi:hypothetical protein
MAIEDSIQPAAAALEIDPMRTAKRSSDADRPPSPAGSLPRVLQKLAAAPHTFAHMRMMKRWTGATLSSLTNSRPERS